MLTTLTQPVIDRRQSLLGVPVVNPGVTWKEKSDGRLTVSVPMRRRPGVLGWFQPQSWQRRVELDLLGSFVLARIDGKKNALEITEEFVARFKVHRREAELCIVAFLKSLLERCIISIAIS